MGIRDILNRNSKATGWGVAAVCILLSGAMAIQLRTGIGPRGPSTLDFYSSDDGKTWFTAEAGQRSPIQRDGKHAYRVQVWRCLKDGHEFVSHLERSVGNAPPVSSGPQASGSRGQQVDVRKPGSPDTAWVKASTKEGMKATEPICPDGHTDVDPVSP